MKQLISEFLIEIKTSITYIHCLEDSMTTTVRRERRTAFVSLVMAKITSNIFILYP